AKWLASFPRVLVHRDFQSQNVIIQNGQANLIDFQGMRPGLAYYDLASLLYDPYIDVAEAERAELIAYYRGRQLENGITIDGDFDLTLRLCAIQRLMQALGAYGFLGLVRGHKNFLQYIPRAVRSLRHIVAKVDNLKPLASFLEELREESSAEKNSVWCFFDEKIRLLRLDFELETKITKKFSIGDHGRSERVTADRTAKPALNLGDILDVIDVPMCQEQEFEIDLKRTQP